MFVLHKRVVYHCYRITIRESAINTGMVPEFLEPADGNTVTYRNLNHCAFSP